MLLITRHLEILEIQLDVVFSAKLNNSELVRDWATGDIQMSFFPEFQTCLYKTPN